MADINNRIEIEPRSFKGRISHPLSIKDISNGIPEVSLVINNTPVNERRIPQVTGKDRIISRPAHRTVHFDNMNKNDPSVNSHMRPLIPSLPTSHINAYHQTQPQKIRQVANTAINSTNQQQKANDSNSKNHNYSPDIRLKFYQKFKDTKIVPDNISNPQNEVKNMPVPIKRSSLPQRIVPSDNIFKESFIEPRIVDKIVQNDNDVDNDGSNNSNDGGNSNENGNINRHNVRQLQDLIKNQTAQIEALKMQIVSLSALHKEKLKNKKILPNADCTADGNNSKSRIIMKQNQQVTHKNKGTNCTVLENKISVGVMTSFEFTLQNKRVHNTNDNDQRHQIVNSDCNNKYNFILPSNMFNRTNDKVDQYMANANNDFIQQNNYYNQSELQRQQSPITQKINIEKTAALSSISLQDKRCLAEENSEFFKNGAQVQPKIGWTFYNNVLCQVNEILNAPHHDIHQPTQHLYNTIMQQKSSARQLKIFGAKIGDLKDIMSTNINQKITANVDTSYYPKVHYQTNVVSSSDSATDSNTSFHMRALAMKYLGNENYAESMMMNEQLFSRVFIDNNDITHNNMSMKAAYNYVHKHALTSDENPFANFEGKRNYQQNNNVLDISVIKQQPKLL